jgi:hypothetical protein
VRAFLLCLSKSTDKLRQPARELAALPEGGTLRRKTKIKFNWEVPKTWLMMQELRLLSFAPSASREITTQRKTRRMILTDLK